MASSSTPWGHKSSATKGEPPVGWRVQRERTARRAGTHPPPLHTDQWLSPGLHPVPCHRTWGTQPPVCSYMTKSHYKRQGTDIRCGHAAPGGTQSRWITHQSKNKALVGRGSNVLTLWRQTPAWFWCTWCKDCYLKDSHIACQLMPLTYTDTHTHARTRAHVLQTDQRKWSGTAALLRVIFSKSIIFGGVGIQVDQRIHRDVSSF